MNKLNGLVILCSIFISSAYADQFPTTYSGIRAQGLGGAAVAFTEGEEAIFYNPAALAGVTNFALNALSLNAEVSNDLLTSYPNFARSFSSPGLSIINELVGKNLSGKVQATSSVLLPGFGVAGIYQQTGSVKVVNLSLPQGTMGYQNTYGVQTGFGWSVAKFKRKKGEIRIGVAGKMLWRGGGLAHLSLSQLLTLNGTTITQSFPGPGSGYGLDLGMQGIFNVNKKLSLLTGLVLTDIGNTAFSSGSPTINQNLTLGLALRYTHGDVMTTLAYDHAHLLQSGDWREKSHLGLEFKMPILSLYSGLYQFHPTYGFGLNLLLFKVTYVSYAADQTPLYNQNAERRHVLQVAVKFDI